MKNYKQKKDKYSHKKGEKSKDKKRFKKHSPKIEYKSEWDILYNNDTLHNAYRSYYLQAKRQRILRINREKRWSPEVRERIRIKKEMEFNEHSSKLIIENKV